ncbi:lytic transglycosylase domain-containing protein [Aestuariibacter sp. A3R04]|uniref:lytic transglycosylase domain-containing protein n=1 Tax=Aestuariibacter sp. A3R04 TaxID=2841571 RepID=UPI001C09A09F|nr:lytic transglycosylase domain-containing protein [Aestuariibacter sp. A3R04]MBU3020518.1 lytic transglycosylase domain-containing protein [Aestuariibacter sp. A3R04]
MKPTTVMTKAILCGFLLAVSAAGWAYSPYKKADIEQMVVTEALAQGLPPSLALAIARVESNFDPYALSHAGARGVMQMMPATALGEYNVQASRLYDPKTNIKLGVTFIKQLIATYDGRVDIALSHYNGGSAVRDRYNNYRIIPATRGYVNKVLAYQREYINDGVDSAAYRGQLATNRGAEAPATDRVTAAVSYTRNNSVSSGDISDPRIAMLQQLRVHNLTRAGGTAHTYQSDDTAVRPQPATVSKRAKVAQWESIYKK